jgi:hypothetical protein
MSAARADPVVTTPEDAGNGGWRGDLRTIAPTVGLVATGEAYAFLVGAPVFKTGERRHPSLVGSIPIRLR